MVVDRKIKFASDVEYPPIKTKTPVFEKVPNIRNQLLKNPKRTKRLDLIRGPELVNNRLMYGDFGIQVYIIFIINS